jgi:hypothetical protein
VESWRLERRESGERVSEGERARTGYLPSGRGGRGRGQISGVRLASSGFSIQVHNLYRRCVPPPRGAPMESHGARRKTPRMDSSRCVNAALVAFLPPSPCYIFFAPFLFPTNWGCSGLSTDTGVCFTSYPSRSGIQVDPFESKF